MHVLLGIAVVAACLWLLSRSIQNARGGAWTGPRSAGMRARSALRQPGVPRAARGGATRSVLSAVTHPGNGQTRAKARADVQTTWHKAMAANWLKQQEHERKNGTHALDPPLPPGRFSSPRWVPSHEAVQPPGLVRGPVAKALKVTGAWNLLPGRMQGMLCGCPECRGGQPHPGPGGAGSANGAGPSANGSGQQPAADTGQPAAQGNGGPPARQASPPPARTSPASTNGGTVAAPSTAGAEQLIEGIQRIHAEAAAGGIRHKQAALKSANEASLRFSSMAQMIARTMSEPGNNYGPEITEPLGQAAQHLQAAAMAFGESDNALTSLIHMTVGELADSPRQAPHHTELSETGTAARGRVLDNEGWH